MFKSLLFIAALFSTVFAQSQELAPQDFSLAINDVTYGAPQLLDVRTFKEYQTGFINNALQADWTNKAEFEERVNALDKSQVVYIYCLSGGRSAGAQAWMLKNGFTQVINLKGGINAWNKESLPLISDMVVAPFDLTAELAKYDSGKKVLVDISATWCPPCKKMQPIVEELKAEQYAVVCVDGGAHSNISKTYNVEAFPTFIVFQNGKEIARKQGVLTKEELIELMK